MVVDRRRFLLLATSACVSGPACLMVPASAIAATYPTRPVRVLVGFPAGGGADMLTRAISEWLQRRMGQPFIVENRPGAATNLATEEVVRAPADGHTLLATTTSNLLNGALYPELKYDFVRDIAPVAGLSIQPLVLVATGALPVGSVPELIAYAKAHPGKLNIGHFGTGTISHLAAELFKDRTGIVAVSVPYRGSAPMLTDLLGGHLHAAFDNIPASIGSIRSGKLRALAVTTQARSDVLADVPSVAQFVPDFEAYTVAGIGAPKGTPAEVIGKLNIEINAGLADPGLRARLADLGAMALPGTPGDFAGVISQESRKWSRLIRSSGIKLD